MPSCQKLVKGKQEIVLIYLSLCFICVLVFLLAFSAGYACGFLPFADRCMELSPVSPFQSADKFLGCGTVYQLLALSSITTAKEHLIAVSDLSCKKKT